MVTPRYLPLELSRSSMVEASKLGSNSLAMVVMACTRPSTRCPMTLMGNSEGYSISDSWRDAPSPELVGVFTMGFLR